MFCVCLDSVILLRAEVATHFYIIPVPNMVLTLCESDRPPGKELVILSTYCKLKQTESLSTESNVALIEISIISK